MSRYTSFIFNSSRGLLLFCGFCLSVVVGAKPAVQIAATLFETVLLATGFILIELSKILYLVLALHSVRVRKWVHTGIFVTLFLIALCASLLSAAEYVSSPFNAMVSGNELFRLLGRQEQLAWLDLELVLMILLMVGPLSVQVATAFVLLPFLYDDWNIDPEKSQLDSDVKLDECSLGQLKFSPELQLLSEQDVGLPDGSQMEDRIFAHSFLRVSIVRSEKSYVDFSELTLLYRLTSCLLGYRPVAPSVLGKQLTALNLHKDKTLGSSTGSVRYHGITYRVMRIDEFLKAINH